ncbi:YHYH protein [Ilumatobacter sp.]|uniref:YHYH protein n=1 Tax=Ilumatobacter sp. TaxID=1967498 RepID=UPI003C463434
MRTEPSPVVRSNRRLAGLLAIPVTLLLASCGSSSDDASSVDDDAETTETAAGDGELTGSDTTDSDTTVTGTEAATSTSSTGTGVDASLFFDGALAEDATTEDCTLSGGAETTCYSLTVAGYPTSHDVGPFCPDTISDSADAGGLWFDGEGLYDLDGQFFVDLPTLYGDDNWQMYDEDGNILVTETAEEFELAANPDVDPSLQNHCVEGMLEWLENGEPITTTVQIPVEPVAADASAAPQGNQGVTLDGVVIAASAPAEAILGAYTIASFDDCGAHFNPFEGYHLHGAVGCSELDTDVADGETPQFGYAMDGYPIHSPLDDADAADLDECNGHTTDELDYHYHANNAAANQVIECLIGQTVAGAGDAGGGGDRPEGPPPGDG